MTWKGVRVHAAAAVAVAASVTAVATATAAASDTKAQGIPTGTLNVGYPLALTGGSAIFDGYIYKGVAMGVAAINNKGGIAGRLKIALHIEDMKSDSATTAVASQDLIDKGASVLIAMCNADQERVLDSIAQRDGRPVFAICNSDPTIAAQSSDWLAVGQGWTVMGAKAAEYMKAKGYHTVYILDSPSIAYYHNAIKYFIDAAKHFGIKVVGTDTWTYGNNDFSPQITKLQAMKPTPDAIFSSIDTPGAESFLKQLRAAGVTIPFVGGDGLDNPQTISLGGAAANGVAFVTHGFPQPGTKTAAFYKAFKAKYGIDPPSIFTAVGYNAVMALDAAVVRAKSVDPKAIIRALSSGLKVPGALWPLSYRAGQRNAVQSVALVQVVKGQFKLLNDHYPSWVPAP